MPLPPLPTPGGDSGLWGAELNAYLTALAGNVSATASNLLDGTVASTVGPGGGGAAPAGWSPANGATLTSASGAFGHPGTQLRIRGTTVLASGFYGGASRHLVGLAPGQPYTLVCAAGPDMPSCALDIYTDANNGAGGFGVTQKDMTLSSGSQQVTFPFTAAGSDHIFVFRSSTSNVDLYLTDLALYPGTVSLPFIPGRVT